MILLALVDDNNNFTCIDVVHRMEEILLKHLYTAIQKKRLDLSESSLILGDEAISRKDI